jgi:aldehyde:ferredoxin oxidoreductase
MIDRKFLDGIDLKWGSVDATLAMIEKIAAREGVGDLASQVRRHAHSVLQRSRMGS